MSSQSLVQVTAWQVTDTTGNHNKYYRALLAGSRVVIQYGRIGTVQSSTPTDYASPAAAIADAVGKIQAKVNNRSKGYEPDGEAVAMSLDSLSWDSPNRKGYYLNGQFEGAQSRGQWLRGSLTDGRAHAVAAVGIGRGHKATDLLGPIAQPAWHGNLDVAVAVLGPAQCAKVDAQANPRVALIDLGHAQAGDNADILSTALKLWTPAGTGPQSHLPVCLDNARMIFAAP